MYTIQRYEQASYAAKEELLHHFDGSDLVLDPQHGRRHVTDNGPGSTRVRRDDDDTYVHLSKIAIMNQFAEQRDHHDRRREIVEDRRKKER